MRTGIVKEILSRKFSGKISTTAWQRLREIAILERGETKIVEVAVRS
jgi:hypothetical protein